jgi:excisionase family DNA binding protein
MQMTEITFRANSATELFEKILEVVPTEALENELTVRLLKEDLMILRGRLTVRVAEAAKLLNCNAATIYRAIERNEIPALRVGQRVSIPAWWLIEKLSPPQSNTVAPTSR